jgi:hypothetical protein
MDALLQQYRGGGANFTHSVTRKAGEQPVKLSVPPEDLEKFYEALANENTPPAVLERMGESTAYSIDLKVCSVPGNSVEDMLKGNGTNPALLGFAQYAAANVAEIYGAAQPFLVYAGQYMDDRSTLPTVIMRTHFPGVLVNADRHAKITSKIKESVEYRTLQNNALVKQVTALGEFLHRCCADQNTWPTALREQTTQEKQKLFRVVLADNCLKGAPAFDNCVMKPLAIFNSADEQVGDGLLEDVEPAEQSLTHLKMATKRPLDCEDTREEHLNNKLVEKLATGEHVTKWIDEPKVKKSDTRTGYGGSVDTEPGAKPRRNFAPDKRSNLEVEAFRTTWGQTSDRFDMDESENAGVIKYSINDMNEGATVTLDMNERSATLVNQGTQANLGVQSAFEAAVTAAGVRR